MNIFIPGGSGYIGSYLVPFLLADGHKVRVLDTEWFGKGHISDNDSCEFIKGDVRDIPVFEKALKGMDTVIYLASISNNDMFAINPTLFWDVNRHAFGANLALAHNAGVKKFIYASSVAGYDTGERPATEEDKLKPLTPYATAKIACEKTLIDCKIPWVIVRSASVCGYSTNQRFDTTFNKMVHDACKHGVITVNGGDQVRSHIHIKDLCDFYRLLVNHKTSGSTYNVVERNQKVRDTAILIAETLGAAITYKPNTDTRSYSVSGEKAKDVLGWKPSKLIDFAIHDLMIRFSRGMWKEDNDSLWKINRGLS